ncbi:MAG: LysR family transcriptional regulator [Anaerolineales bacterium]|nr:LysR family transcriptional regulator [Anaerolineales bacterium]
MIDIDKISTFVRAAETLSFSEAAKQLHISQPTVSNHIKTLEQKMGVTLFTRTNTGLELTEAGKVLLPWARRLLHDTNSMQAMMSSIQNDVVGELRIACSTTAGKYVLPQLAARFCQHFPGVKVRILACMPEDVTLRLLEGEAHIGVLSREVPDAGLESQEFFRDTITLIVPANHRWAFRGAIEASELLEEPLIMREETSGTRRVVLSELAKFDISLNDLNIFMELGNAEAIVRTVSAGYGIAFVSKLATACPLERGNVVDIEVEGMNLRCTIFMARKTGSSHHRPRDAFWGFIHDPENADLIHLPEQRA